MFVHKYVCIWINNKQRSNSHELFELLHIYNFQFCLLDILKFSQQKSLACHLSLSQMDRRADRMQAHDYQKNPLFLENLCTKIEQRKQLTIAVSSGVC